VIRVGLTQRVEVSRHGERRDALDQNWARLLASLDCLVVPLPNLGFSGSELLLRLQLDAVVFTGGNDYAGLPDASSPAPERDRFELELVKACLSVGRPMLGICRGMQLLNIHFGGKLSRVERHAAVRHAAIAASDAPACFRELADINSYHNFGIRSSDLPPSLTPLVTAPDGTIEAFLHPREKVIGLMWHIERPPEPPVGLLDYLGGYFAGRA